jgi:hypothetical protein
MSEDSSARPSPPAPIGFAKSFAWLVLISLVVLVFVCDALPAIGARLPGQGDIGTGPVASLYHFLFDFFWPGTILVHAGLATLWLACGTWRFSLRLLSVILSMSARAAWIWKLYGVTIASTVAEQYGEPFKVCGIPILFSMVILFTSFGFRGWRIQTLGVPKPRERLQTIDLMAWTTAIALLLAPILTFFRAMTPSLQEDRLQYDTPLAVAWAALTWFSAILTREWLVDGPLSTRWRRIGWTVLALSVVSGVLIVSARLIAVWGPEDMLFSILAYLLPSTIAWCMATGWTLRELGIRLVPRSTNGT